MTKRKFKSGSIWYFPLGSNRVPNGSTILGFPQPRPRRAGGLPPRAHLFGKRPHSLYFGFNFGLCQEMGNFQSFLSKYKKISEQGDHSHRPADRCVASGQDEHLTRFRCGRGWWLGGPRCGATSRPVCTTPPVLWGRARNRPDTSARGRSGAHALGRRQLCAGPGGQPSPGHQDPPLTATEVLAPRDSAGPQRGHTGASGLGARSVSSCARRQGHVSCRGDHRAAPAQAVRPVLPPLWAVLGPVHRPGVWTGAGPGSPRMGRDDGEPPALAAGGGRGHQTRRLLARRRALPGPGRAWGADARPSRRQSRAPAAGSLLRGDGVGPAVWGALPAFNEGPTRDNSACASPPVRGQRRPLRLQQITGLIRA